MVADRAPNTRRVTGISMCSTPARPARRRPRSRRATQRGRGPTLAAPRIPSGCDVDGTGDLGRERREMSARRQRVVHIVDDRSGPCRPSTRRPPTTPAPPPARCRRASAVQDHRVHGAPAVVDGRCSARPPRRRCRDRPRPSHTQCVGKRRRGSVCPRARPADATVRRRIGALRGRRHLEQIDRAIGSLHAESAAPQNRCQRPADSSSMRRRASPPRSDRRLAITMAAIRRRRARKCAPPPRRSHRYRRDQAHCECATPATRRAAARSSSRARPDESVPSTRSTCPSGRTVTLRALGGKRCDLDV